MDQTRTEPELRIRPSEIKAQPPNNSLWSEMNSSLEPEET